MRKNNLKKLISCVSVICLLLLCGADRTAVFAGSSTNDAQTYASSSTVLVVKDSNTNRIRKTYTLQDFTSMQTETEYPIESGNSDKLVFQKISGTNQNNLNTAWYGVIGVTVEYLVRDLGVWDSFTKTTFLSSDNESVSFTKTALETPGKYYFEDSDKKGAQVYPMLGLWYTESDENQFADPQRPLIDKTSVSSDAPRIFVGQSVYHEINRGELVKNIAVMYIDFPNDEFYDVPPTISGVPGQPIYLQQGQQFNYPSGIYAKDAYGNSVKVTKSVRNEDGSKDYVDVNTLGTYTITYRAEDERGNVTNAYLTVIVSESAVQKGNYAIKIQQGAGYSVRNTDQSSMTALSDSADAVCFSVKITPEKRYGTSQTVIFAHFSGNKLAGLSTQKLSIDKEKIFTGSFAMKKGDIVKVFVADSFNSKSGSGTYLMNHI